MSDTAKQKEGEKRDMKTTLHCIVEEEQNIFKIKASFKLPLFSFQSDPSPPFWEI